jgi:hypothetical protein
MGLLQLLQEVLAIDAFASPYLSSSDALIDHPHRSIVDSATPVGVIDFIALVSLGEQTSSSVQGARPGVMLDQARFSSQPRGRDDVDTGQAEQEDIERLHESSSHFLVCCEDPLAEQLANLSDPWDRRRVGSNFVNSRQEYWLLGKSRLGEPERATVFGETLAGDITGAGQQSAKRSRFPVTLLVFS